MTGPAPSQPRIGEYFLEQQLGQGGQSVVWLGRSVRTGNRAAIKVLRSEFIGPTEIARLHREWTLLASLSVPGLPKAYEFIQVPESGVCALAMEYLAGIQLDRVQHSQPLSLIQLLQLASELSRIVAELHRRGIVHRDIKPSNLLLMPGWESNLSGRVALVDFGIANSGEQQTRYTATGSAIGTFAYMPPESLLGNPERGSPRIDVYSIGVLLYSCLFRCHPTGVPLSASLPQLIAAHSNRQQGAISSDQVATINQTLPGFVDLIRQCVSPEPAPRPQNAVVLFDALSRISVREGPRSTSAPVSQVPDSSWTNLARSAGGFTNLPASARPIADAQQPAVVEQVAPIRDPTATGANPLSTPDWSVQPTRAAGVSTIVLLGGFFIGVAILGVIALGVALVIFSPQRTSSRRNPQSSSPQSTVGQGTLWTAVVVTSDRTAGVVRDGPGFGFTARYEVPYGARVSVVGSSSADGWIPVVNGSGQAGWMHRDILRPE